MEIAARPSEEHSRVSAAARSPPGPGSCNWGVRDWQREQLGRLSPLPLPVSGPAPGGVACRCRRPVASRVRLSVRAALAPSPLGCVAWALAARDCAGRPSGVGHGGRCDATHPQHHAEEGAEPSIQPSSAPRTRTTARPHLAPCNPLPPPRRRRIQAKRSCSTFT